MECSWDVLVKNVKSAKDLDDVIAAHEQFLKTVLARALLDEDSEVVDFVAFPRFIRIGQRWRYFTKFQSLLTQLRTIYDVIIQFESVQNKLWKEATQELQIRNKVQDKINANTARVGFVFSFHSLVLGSVVVVSSNSPLLVIAGYMGSGGDRRSTREETSAGLY